MSTKIDFIGTIAQTKMSPLQVADIEPGIIKKAQPIGCASCIFNLIQGIRLLLHLQPQLP